MERYYRGCTRIEGESLMEAIEDGNLVSQHGHTHWTDSLEKAMMYARRHANGVVVEVELEEDAPGMGLHFSVGEGDSALTTIRQWVLPDAYFNNRFSAYVEEAVMHTA